MAAKDLNFVELMRFARVQEARVSFRSNDPLINKKKLDYIQKADSGSLTQEEFNDCLNNKFPEIISYIKHDSEVFSEKNIISALKINGLLLKNIPLKKQTENILKTAFSQNGLSLEYCNIKLLNDEIVKIAIRQNPECKGSLIGIYNKIGNSSLK